MSNVDPIGLVTDGAVVSGGRASALALALEGMLADLGATPVEIPPVTVGQYALCTVADVLDMVGPADTAEQLVIAKMINRVSDYIERRTACRWAARAYDETGTGNGTSRYFTRNSPITSVEEVSIDGVVLDPTTYGFNSFSIYRKLGWHFPEFDIDNIRVKYHAGWYPVPGSVVELAAEMAAYRFTQYQQRRVGVTSQSHGEGSRTYFAGNFLPGHEERLDLLRRSGYAGMA